MNWAHFCWPMETCVIPYLTDSGAFPMDTHAAVAVFAYTIYLPLVLYLTLYHTLVVLIDPMMISVTHGRMDIIC